MTEPATGIRRMSLAMASNTGLSSLLNRFRAGLSLDRVLWNGQDRRLQTGVLPPGIDEPRAVAELVRAAHQAVLAENRGRDAESGPVRLRLALHEGLVVLVDGEFRGPAVSTVRALCEDGQIPSVRADLVVVLSQRIFDDLSALGAQPVFTARFRQITAGTLHAHATAWSGDALG